MRVVDNMCVLYHMNSLSLWMPEQDVIFSLTGRAECCETPYGYRESILCPLEKQHVLPTLKPSLPLEIIYFLSWLVIDPVNTTVKCEDKESRPSHIL